MALTIRKAGDPVLRQRARPLTRAELRTREIQNLVDAMVETMRQAPGVGLAAPQVGHPLRIVVLEDRRKYQARFSKRELTRRERKPVPLQILINPRIASRSGPHAIFKEGCLSIDGVQALTPRDRLVTVAAWDRHGNRLPMIHARGWHARILQHEIDHLKGRLFLDRAPATTIERVPHYVIPWLERTIRRGAPDVRVQSIGKVIVLGPETSATWLERFSGYLLREFDLEQRVGLERVRAAVERFLTAGSAHRG